MQIEARNAYDPASGVSEEDWVRMYMANKGQNDTRNWSQPPQALSQAGPLALNPYPGQRGHEAMQSYLLGEEEQNQKAIQSYLTVDEEQKQKNHEAMQSVLMGRELQAQKNHEAMQAYLIKEEEQAKIPYDYPNGGRFLPYVGKEWWQAKEPILPWNRQDKGQPE